jgi:hypothetical protein
MTIDSMTRPYCFLYGPRGPASELPHRSSLQFFRKSTRDPSVPACIAWVTRKECLFFAFDLLFLNGQDLRELPFD